jgi:nucleotide-binding universal stress UspA family protein
MAKKCEGIVLLCTILSDQSHLKTPLIPNQQIFDEFITRFDTTNVTVSHHIKTGRITPTLLEFIEKENIDLVVMGTSGSRGWNEAFMGSNIGKLVRTSPVPVFAVKNGISLKQIKNIVFPFGMMREEKHLISEIRKLQNFFDARLHLLFVNTNPSTKNPFGLQKMKEYACFERLVNYTVNVTDNEIEKDGILQFAKEINADMIAMGTHGNRKPENMYVSSIAADVVNHANMITWTCATENALDKSL